ncbi:hypothetical protein GCM10010964_27750 [Caldovatus sediminis]|uniref:Uncharacterized protein n=1 Tax=Caldovatus sediminis TaxID=2041189 RepID=A0A8J2ZCG6_9PROT|nr:hypothetical protein GCM10010964_27750 [Caldovatus sediminis]
MLPRRCVPRGARGDVARRIPDSGGESCEWRGARDAAMRRRGARGWGGWGNRGADGALRRTDTTALSHWQQRQWYDECMGEGDRAARYAVGAAPTGSARGLSATVN